jgi:hypothetical protein
VNRVIAVPRTPESVLRPLAYFSARPWSLNTAAGGRGCVEVAFLPDGTVGVRDTKDRTRPALTVTPTAWATFLSATRTGHFG